MNWFKKIFQFLNTKEREALFLYVKCDACGTIIKIRVDLMRDLQSTYQETGVQYELRKEAMDNKCFKKMTIQVEFDGNKDVLSRNIEGGSFVSEEEFI